MYEITDSGRKRICVGIQRKGNVGGPYKKYYKIYDAESDTCEDIEEAEIKQILKGKLDIVNLELSERGAVKCTYIDKEKLEYLSLTVVGIVNKSRHNKDIIGYDVVTNDGRKTFLEAKETYKNAWAEVVRNMEVDYRDSDTYRYKKGGAPLYVRYVEEDPNEGDEQTRLNRLKGQLVDVLTQMNAIRPVQFCDVDCDNGVYNFSNVVIDEADNRVYVEIAMYHDNLPAHAKNPLKNGKGIDILPQKTE